MQTGTKHDVLVWAASEGTLTASGQDRTGWVWACSCERFGEGYESEDAADRAVTRHIERVS